MTTRRRLLPATLALALAAGLTACGPADEPGPGVSVESPSAGTTTEAAAPSSDDDDAASSDDDAATTQDAATSSADDAATGDLGAPALAAVATAEAEVGGTAYGLDDQDDDGTWEVDVAVGDRSVEVTVDADGRAVGTSEEDDLDDDDRAGLEAATTTLAEAVGTALAEVGETLDDVELDEDDGTWVWTVSVERAEDGDDVEVLVDVVTGEVVRVDP